MYVMCMQLLTDIYLYVCNVYIGRIVGKCGSVKRHIEQITGADIG